MFSMQEPKCLGPLATGPGGTGGTGTTATGVVTGGVAGSDGPGGGDLATVDGRALDPAVDAW